MISIGVSVQINFEKKNTEIQPVESANLLLIQNVFHCAEVSQRHMFAVYYATLSIQWQLQSLFRCTLFLLLLGR